MPCLVVLLIAMFPRVILVLAWLFTSMLTRAYSNMVIPLLGFIFLPITTLVYAWMVNNGMPLNGVNLFIIVVAVLLDAGSHGSSGGYYRRRRL